MWPPKKGQLWRSKQSWPPDIRVGDPLIIVEWLGFSKLFHSEELVVISPLTKATIQVYEGDLDLISDSYQDEEKTHETDDFSFPDPCTLHCPSLGSETQPADRTVCR